MIVCLGWGSLISDRDGLPLTGGWSIDGPALPLEFARESQDHRMTLVIAEHDRPVPVLWAELAVDDLGGAVEALRVREKMPSEGAVGRWPAGSRRHPHEDVIGAWAKARGFDGVVWTALRGGMRADREGGSYRTPSLEQIALHLEALDPEARARVARYVHRAPSQIATPYRSALERILGHDPDGTPK